MDANDSVGLCRTCSFARVVVSAKGSRFYLCRRSESDPRYPRYPRLPVLSCDGYEAARTRRSRGRGNAVEKG